jgi:hypothetical protein
MKRIFECNDESSLAGDISFGPKLSTYMNSEKSKKMTLKSQLSLESSNPNASRPPLPNQRALTAGGSFNNRKKGFAKGANNDAF